MKKEIIADEKLVAYCGLYCGGCKRYLIGKCPGCDKNEKASWCGVRKCCKTNNFKSCAQCHKFSDLNNCKDFNNFFSKLFGLIFRSDRKACIEKIKEIGTEEFAKEMTEKKSHTVKRK